MKVTLREKKLSNGNSSLYLDYYIKGNRKYEFLSLQYTKDKVQNKEVKKLAENIRAKRLLELQNNTYGFIPDFKKRTNFYKYFESIQEKKPTQIDGYTSTLIHIEKYAGTSFDISQIDGKWLEGFKEYLLKNVSQNSAVTYFTVIKTVLKQAVSDKLITEDITKNIKGIKPKDIERVYLLLDEIEKLAKTDCRLPEVKKAFLFSCFTGLRFSDIKKLIWGEINNNNLEYRQKKTNSVENLPLSSTAIDILNSYFSDNIIPLGTNKVFNIPQRVHTNVVLKEWCKSAKVEKSISFHTARHTFATLNLTNGNDLYTVSKLLGHKNINTTQIYAKIIDEKKREAINNLPKIKF